MDVLEDNRNGSELEVEDRPAEGDPEGEEEDDGFSDEEVWDVSDHRVLRGIRHSRNGLYNDMAIILPSVSRSSSLFTFHRMRCP